MSSRMIRCGGTTFRRPFITYMNGTAIFVRASDQGSETSGLPSFRGVDSGLRDDVVVECTGKLKVWEDPHTFGAAHSLLVLVTEDRRQVLPREHVRVDHPAQRAREEPPAHLATLAASSDGRLGSEQ